MKWKILIKLLYIGVLFTVASLKWEKEEPKLIDSDPHIEKALIKHV